MKRLLNVKVSLTVETTKGTTVRVLSLRNYDSVTDLTEAVEKAVQEALE